jgi:hypothetical protein
LKGTEIPISARVVCLADAFDAMTSTRPYRVGLPLEFAMQEMKKLAGRQFCPECVDAFIRVLKSKGVVEEAIAPAPPAASPGASEADGKDSKQDGGEPAAPSELRTGT